MDLNRRAVVGLGMAGASLAAASLAQAAPQIPVGLDVQGDDAHRYASAVEDIRAYAGLHMAVYGLPGLTLSVVGPDGFAAYMRFGPAGAPPVDVARLFQIGSISKSFTALCIFRLMDAGKLSLDADVRDLLPGVPLPPGKTSVQNLLNHSSGLPDDAPLFPRGGDQRLWRGFEPGSHWSYSNLGFLMLGSIVERLEGRPLAAVIRRHILEPLGMVATKGAILTGDRALYAEGHSPFYSDREYPRAGPLGPGPWTDVTQGAGCVASTASDMARYCRFLIAAGQGKGAPLLSDAAAARFTKATIDAPGWAVPGSKYANGLAVVEVGGRPLLHHTGGMLAFNSAIHVDPKGGVGAFASTNVGLAPYRPRDITAYACTRLRAVVEGGSAPSPSPTPPKAPDISAYLGEYEGRQGQRLTLSAVQGNLSARLADQALALELNGEDAFIAADPHLTPYPLVFRRTGKAVTRAWHAGSEFVRIEAGRRVAPFSPATPPALEVLTGHYESDDPWAGSFRVTAQGEALFLDDVTPLVALPGGLFRVGDKDWSPERLRFDALLDGRPQRAVLSGVDHVRRPT
jgi:CubicO group peptidase (beta-lactamase class C family)